MRRSAAALVFVLIATFGVIVPSAAAATGDPKVVIIVGATHGATAGYRADADLRKRTPRLDGGCEQLSRQTRARAARAQSRDSPLSPSPFGPVQPPRRPVGLVRSGSERVVAQAHHEVGQRGVGEVAVGQDRAAVRRRLERGPGHRDGGVVPREPELIRAVVLVRDEIDQLEQLDASNPWATPVGM